MDNPLQQSDFDWHAERTSQLRDLSRFGGELDRTLSLRSRTPSVRSAAARIREQWERLKRRLDGRSARFGDQWDRLLENADQVRRERDRLSALTELEERLSSELELDAILEETLNCTRESLACDGAMIVLQEVGGRAVHRATERRKGRAWPVAADRELADMLAAGVRSDQRITIEGRPVGSGPRERGRAAHWLAVAVGHESEHYGAIVAGRPAAETGFMPEDGDALAAITKRLGRALASRIGVGARPVLGAGPKPEGFEQLWGESSVFKRALALSANYALSESPVLIEGEPGTGRETVARAIHKRSPRSSGRVIVTRVADLPEEIVSRQLFGVHIVTPDGITIDRPGDIELAEGGTLVIDEVTALNAVHQVRLIRLLQEGEFERDGDRSIRRADVRLIVSTSQDIDRAFSEGRLRQDLYYLITVARVALPPLRERGSDIVELARRFAQAAARKHNKPVEGIDVAAAGILSNARFPGNVKQLAQVIERAVLLAHDPLISPQDLPDAMADIAPVTGTDANVWMTRAVEAVRAAAGAGRSGDYRALKRAKQDIVTAAEGAFVDAVVATVGWAPSRAARHCGLHRAQWQRLQRATGGRRERPAVTRDAAP